MRWLWVFILLHNVAFANEEIESYIELASEQSSFSSDTLKAIFWIESRWGKCPEPDLGIGQINEEMVRKFYPNISVPHLLTNWQYNINMSVMILEDKLDWARWRETKPDWDDFCNKYGVHKLTDFELAILAYNGVRRDHVYLETVKRFTISKPWSEKVSSGNLKYNK